MSIVQSVLALDTATHVLVWFLSIIAGAVLFAALRLINIQPNKFSPRMLLLIAFLSAIATAVILYVSYA